MTSMTSPQARGVLGAVSARFAEVRETHLLGLVRVAFGVMLFLHAQRLARELDALGYFGDRFFLPLIPAQWVPSASVYLAMLIAMRVLAAAIVLGVRARESLLLVSCMGLYLLACDRLQYHNNRYALLLLAFLLAFTPCDRSCVLRTGRARALPAPPAQPSGTHPSAGSSLRSSSSTTGPVWAQRLFQLQVSLVYLGSSLSKLFDPDWFGGQVMWVRAARSLDEAAQRGIELPAFVIAAYSSKLVLSVLSKIAISLELFLAVGLWHARTRVLALWWGVWFHFGIEVGANVELFSYVMWASYIAFATPELRERQWLVADDAPRAQRMARLLRRLDWLSRWTIALVPRTQLGGRTYAAIDRDGSRAVGQEAITLLARATPLLFPLWLPLAVAAALRRQPRASS